VHMKLHNQDCQAFWFFEMISVWTLFFFIPDELQNALIVKYIIYLKQSNATFVYVTIFNRTTCFGKTFPSSGPYYTVRIVERLQCLSRVKNYYKNYNNVGMVK
jgi:hypothetical protein